MLISGVCSCCMQEAAQVPIGVWCKPLDGRCDGRSGRPAVIPATFEYYRPRSLDEVIDLLDLAELRSIRSDGGSLVIGAMATQHALIASELLAAKCPIIRETALQ